MALNGVNLGEGAFAYLDPPFDPARVILQQSELTLQTLVDLESQALNHGRDNFRQVLKNQGRLETGISDESVDTNDQRDSQTSRFG
jgi:hypothetical protein